MNIVGNMQNAHWKQIWFSEDQSLIAVIQEDAANVTAGSHIAVVFDVLANKTRNNFFSPGVVSEQPQITTVRLENNVVKIDFRDASGDAMQVVVSVP